MRVNFAYFITSGGCSASIWRGFSCQKFSSFFGSTEKSDEFGTLFAGHIINIFGKNILKNLYKTDKVLIFAAFNCTIYENKHTSDRYYLG